MKLKHLLPILLFGLISGVVTLFMYGVFGYIIAHFLRKYW